jgi:type II secretory pathway component PulJ
MNRKQFRGLTLVELFITMAVFLMLGSTMFMMMVKSKKIFQASTTRSASRQEIQTALWKMARELRGSAKDYVTVGASPAQAFSFLSAENSSGIFMTGDNGSAVWQKYIIYYIPAGTSKLLRKEVYKDFTTTAAAPLSTTELSSYLNGKGTMISAAAKKLSLSILDTPNTVKLAFGTYAKNRQGNVDQQTGEITVYLYNNTAR